MVNESYPVEFLNEQHTTIEERFQSTDISAFENAVLPYAELLTDPELVSVEFTMVGRYKNDAVLVESGSVYKRQNGETHIDSVGHVFEPSSEQTAFDLYTHLCNSLRVEVHSIDGVQYLDIGNTEGEGRTFTLNPTITPTPDEPLNKYG